MGGNIPGENFWVGIFPGRNFLEPLLSQYSLAILLLLLLILLLS